MGRWVPASHDVGHCVQLLKGVTIQSFLQGIRQGRTVSGRGASGHLRETTESLKYSWDAYKIHYLSLNAGRSRTQEHTE